ncbi:MAG: hypothetical protein JO261_09825 [Alphaproteobacteria bacterium]|nr:hypothetical protein [Alphaproteobacteria bacterium]MBV9693988.1 hypothetical protein [Alphaproteobacteria bacterium]
MRTHILGLGLCAALSLAAGARADDANTASAQPASASPGDRIVCHRLSHEGMLLRTAICKSQKDWDKDRQKREADFATVQYRSYSAPFGR